MPSHREGWRWARRALTGLLADANNVCRSLAMAAVMVGMDVRVRCPRRLPVLPATWIAGRRGPCPRSAGGSVEALSDPSRPSMASMPSTPMCVDIDGQEAESLERLAAFEGYCVDDALLRQRGRARSCCTACRRTVARRSLVGGRRRAQRGLAPGGAPANRNARHPGVAGGHARRAGRGAAVNKNQRQHRIAKLLAAQPVSSQSQLVELLADEEIEATQTTVSRDLEELGAIKVRLPVARAPTSCRSCRPSRSPPRTTSAVCLASGRSSSHSRGIWWSCGAAGCAHVVGSALDRSGLEGLLGTVAGDDTVLAVVSESHGGAHGGPPGQPLGPHPNRDRRPTDDQWARSANEGRMKEWQSGCARLQRWPWTPGGGAVG